MKKIILILCLAIGYSSLHAQTTTKTKTTHKKGWSHAKKGAVIGAGAGAVTGAAVSKKRGKGALIGGAVGAGAGYLFGRHKDKKDPQRKTIVKTKTVKE